MANFDLLVIEAGKQKVRPSATNVVDFSSVNIGASALGILEASGHFDFSGLRLTNLADGTLAGHASTKGQLDAGLGLKINLTEKGVASGVATLDGGGKIPAAQLPNSIMEYQGTWSASANSPALANGAGNAGDVYVATTAGSVDFGAGTITFVVGDWVMYSGSVWEKSVNSNSVASVFGRSGAVSSAAGDYTAAQITNTPAGNIAATTVQAAINELDTEKEVANSNIQSHIASTSNPHGTTKAQVGLGNVDDTSDANKPVSAAQQVALDLKQDILTASNGIRKVGADVQRDDAIAKTNDNAGTITVRQAVYIKANGNVDLARATVAALGDFAIGLVEDATIATAASGRVAVRHGAIVGGYSGLTPGMKQYVSRTTAGALTESLTGFVAGESVYSVGRAISATQIVFSPMFEFEY